MLQNKKKGNKTNIETFLKKCYQKTAKNKTIKNISLQKSHNGWIFKIGKRGSPNYFRVYENHTKISNL